MDAFHIRDLAMSDMAAVSPLLDAALGVGFWDSSDMAREVALVADADGAQIGVATASIDKAGDNVTGHIRLVAVDQAWRRHGVATRLVRELVGRCEALGAKEHMAYAWVYGATGTAPVAGALEQAGFCLVRRIEGFYSGMTTGQCPACHRSTCVCPADLYVRTATGAKSQQAHAAHIDRGQRC